MKSVIVVLGCALSLGAQITGTLIRRPDGGEEIRIRNQSAAPVIAYAVYVKRASDDPPYLTFVDNLDPGAKPLPANEELLVGGLRLALHKGPIYEEPVVTAGILADGTTIGDPGLLRRLVLRRCNLLQAVDVSLEMLTDAGRRNIPRDQLINQFKRMADSLRHWYLPPEQQVGRDVYQAIIAKLVNLPQGEPGAAFPPTDFVEQETARLNRQRVTLAGSQPSLAAAALLIGR